MDERLKRVKRVTDLIEYRNRRFRHDMTPRQSLKIASYDAATRINDIDTMIERIEHYKGKTEE